MVENNFNMFTSNLLSRYKFPNSFETKQPYKLPKQYIFDIPKNNLKHTIPFTNLVETLFKSTYVLCFSPFLIEKNPVTGTFYLNQNKFQKLVSFVFSILGLLYELNQNFKNKQYISQPELETPINYLTLLTFLFGFAYRLKIMHKFWFQAHHFLEFTNCVNNFHKYKYIPKPPYWMEKICQ